MTVHFTRTRASVSDSELSAVEQRLGVTLPEPYRAHLLQHNGGRPDRTDFLIAWPAHAAPALEELTRGSVLYFLSVADPASEVDLVQEHAGDRGYVPDDTIAIARDPGGNPILLGVTGPNRGRVFYQLTHEGAGDQQGPATEWDNVGVVADNFDAFLAALRSPDD